MAREGSAAERARSAPDPDSERKPDSPTDIEKPGWKYTAKAAFGEFQRDQCTDLAAALTYYSVLSVFPAILALVSLLGLFGQGEATTSALLDIVRQLGQGQVADQLKGPIDQIVGARGAGLAFVVGLVGAIWSASGYVGAFGRAMNRVYQVDEGRPIWKLRPVVLLITIGLVIMAALVLVGLVVSGPVAHAIGDVVGLGEQSVTVWNIVKWPVMLGIVIVIVAVLYYATPNVRQPKFRWVSVGAAVAILVWVLASVAFGFYVTNFSSYNKTYGSLAGVIVFLLWLWITNLALLFGAEIDAELERARELQAGIEAERTIQLPPRDSRASEKAEAKLEEKIAEGRDLRMSSQSSGGDGGDTEGSRDRHRSEVDRTTDEGAAPQLEPLPSREPRTDPRRQR
jgi:membrane protein